MELEPQSSTVTSVGRQEEGILKLIKILAYERYSERLC